MEAVKSQWTCRFCTNKTGRFAGEPRRNPGHFTSCGQCRIHKGSSFKANVATNRGATPGADRTRAGGSPSPTTQSAPASPSLDKLVTLRLQLEAAGAEQASIQSLDQQISALRAAKEAAKPWMHTLQDTDRRLETAKKRAKDKAATMADLQAKLAEALSQHRQAISDRDQLQKERDELVARGAADAQGTQAFAENVSVAECLPTAFAMAPNKQGLLEALRLAAVACAEAAYPPVRTPTPSVAASMATSGGDPGAKRKDRPLTADALQLLALQELAAGGYTAAAPTNSMAASSAGATTTAAAKKLRA